MTRQLRTCVSLVMIALVIFTGCHPTQPFYFHEDGDLSHYLDHATAIEDPDLNEPMLAEVEMAEAPLTLSNPNPREMWDLSLEEVVSIALNNSKVIRNLGSVTPFGFSDGLTGRTAGNTTVYDTAILEADPTSGVEAALAAFDAQLSVVGSNNGNIFSQTDRPSTFQPNVVINRSLGGLRTELSKRSASGTQMFFRNQTDYTRGANLFGGAQPVDSIWESLFEAEVRQPLLRGRGALVNRIPVMLARINSDVSVATFEASVRNLLLDIENTYWDLHAAYRNLETAQTGRDSAQVTWHNTWLRMKGDLASSQEEARARTQYFFFRAQLESALRDLFATETRLRFLMGLAASDGRLIRPSDEPTTALVQFDWREIHAEAVTRSTELRQQRWVIKRRELELQASRNNLLPQLDVGALYRWYGIGDHLINADRNGLNFAEPNNLLHNPTGSTAFDVLTEGDYQEAAMFFSFQMPVGFRRELANVRQAQLNIAREKARLEDMELNTSHLLSTAIRNMDFQYAAAQSQFNRWHAAQTEVEAIETLYQGSKITIDQVLDSQRERAQAQIDYYRAVSEYNKSVAEVHFRKGSLLEYNSIQLAEGPWPEKAYWDALGHARERDASYYLDYGSTRPNVVSRGATAQHLGDQVFAAPMFEGGEYIVPSPNSSPGPSAQPTPADRQPEELPPANEVPVPNLPNPLPNPTPAPQPESRQPGPVTERPSGPSLGPANRRADVVRPGHEQMATQPPERFEWGSLGLGGRGNNSAQPGNAVTNPLRQVSFERTE